jgi:predicted nucleic acid-binding protein
MTVTFDSSAWIEYFAGSALGKDVKKFVDSSESINTPVIDLMEIKNKYVREKKKWRSRIDFICERSLIIDIDQEIALLASDLKNKYGLYSIDALIYASAQTTKSKLLTKDNHFKNLKDVIILE